MPQRLQGTKRKIRNNEVLSHLSVFATFAAFRHPALFDLMIVAGVARLFNHSSRALPGLRRGSSREYLKIWRSASTLDRAFLRRKHQNPSRCVDGAHAIRKAIPRMAMFNSWNQLRRAGAGLPLLPIRNSIACLSLAGGSCFLLNQFLCIFKPKCLQAHRTEGIASARHDAA